MPVWFFWFSVMLILSIAVMIAGTGFAIYLYNLEFLYAEHGLLEQSQVTLLLLSCIAFFIANRRNDSPARLITLFCSLLCLSFILRELDVEKTWAPDWVKWIGAGIGRDLILTAAFLVVLTYALRYFDYYWQTSRQFLRSLPARLLVLGGSLLVIGDLCESLDDIIEHSKFFEESIELYGYAMITLAAVATLIRLAQPTTPATRSNSATRHTRHLKQLSESVTFQKQ